MFNQSINCVVLGSVRFVAAWWVYRRDLIFVEGFNPGFDRVAVIDRSGERFLEVVRIAELGSVSELIDWISCHGCVGAFED